MRPLLVLLERLWGPLGASLTALGASWSLFGGSWMGLGSSWEALGDGLGSSSGALQDVFSLRGSGEPVFSKMSVSSRREHHFENLHEQEREASY